MKHIPTSLLCASPAMRYRFSRPGVTILEVLFAVMIATVGLLGALAVFPVASSQARKGQLADQVASGGDMAVHTFDTIGLRRPDRWVWWNDYSYFTGTNKFRVYANTTENYTQDLNNGDIIPDGHRNADGSFNSWKYREALLIDPLFIADNSNLSASPQVVVNASATLNATTFPSTFQAFGLTAAPLFPMRRVTMPNGFGGIMTRLQAESLMRIEDSLAWVRPDNQAVPAQQIFTDLNGFSQGLNVNPGKRQDEGRLSWIAMIVPKMNYQTNLFLPNEFTLSIIVMENRPSNLALDANLSTIPNPEDFLSEWFVDVTSIYSQVEVPQTGSGKWMSPNGGDIQVTASAPQFLKTLKRGSWAMLSTAFAMKDDNPSLPYYADTSNAPILSRTHRWYRVLETSTVNAANQMDITLDGADWLVGSRNQLTIVPNVVAVFERSIHLERD